ncbi:MAG TPA: LacI family DNA-binding transcriptional regulator [Symbiobacteriaceae bacterium]|nr:LacI family DNA-binding transcriptional regulator [Symbiobacteriaceae bacterium]
MEVTIRDVAKRAGVSIATVSVVINKTRPVNDTLRQRVFDAIRDLDYKPNVLAQSLRSRRSRLLGLVLTDIRNPFMAEEIVGLEEGAASLGYQVIIHNTGEVPERIDQAFQDLMAARVAGLIIATARVGDLSLLKQIQARKTPYVFINRTPRPGMDYYVGTDNVAIGQLAARHLLSLGHRRLACIAGASCHSSSWERYSGYLAALTEAGVEVPNDYVQWTDGFSLDGGQMATRLLLQLPDPPTAIFVASDIMAVGAIRAIQEAHLRVPDDVSIVGVDNINLSDCFLVPLTTVNQPKQEMGSEAAKMLVGRIAGRTDYPTSVIFTPKLVVRQSCGSLRR